jgi:hypothetical protein
MKYSKVIIWGHPIHSHTHSYIHYGFYKAFKHMGYETLWLTNDDDISNINFENCLFLTEGQVDDKMPKNKTSTYILHNVNGAKYTEIDNKHRINLQFFSTEAIRWKATKINDYTYMGSDVIYLPWATDLLPHEFSENDAHNEINNRECVWAGSYSPGDRSEYENNTELDPFFNECRKNNIRVRHIDPWVKPISPEENRNIIHNSFLAPAINGAFQKKTYYIPCRIFKNISYGHFGITNNSHVNAIFDNKLVYDSNTTILFQKAMEKKNDPHMIDELKFLINEVRNKHTYINRANAILDFIESIS